MTSLVDASSDGSSCRTRKALKSCLVALPIAVLGLALGTTWGASLVPDFSWLATPLLWTSGIVAAAMAVRTNHLRFVEMRRTLEVRQEINRRLLDSCRRSVVIVDQDGIITDASPTADHLLGTADKKLVGLPLSTVVPTFCSAEVLRCVNEALTGVEATCSVSSYTAVRGIGQTVEMYCNPVNGPAKSPIGVICAVDLRMGRGDIVKCCGRGGSGGALFDQFSILEFLFLLRRGQSAPSR